MDLKDHEDLREIFESYKSYVTRLEAKLAKGIAGTDDIESIDAILSHELTRAGLNDNDEPNELGMKIERLIDKLSTYTSRLS